MNADEAILIVKPHLTKKRFDHTLRVAETAVELAQLFYGPKNKAKLAAILHDYAKYRSLDEMKRWIINSSLPKDLLQYDHELWHGPVGALLIEREHGFSDRDVLYAIRYHTTGKANMSKLEMILFLSDYIEPGRDFPGINKIREMARKDLEYACWMASRNMIRFLIQKNMRIYPDTFYAYNNLSQIIDRNKE